MRAHSDKFYSLCDALSFVVMERIGITDAISFDRHFREYLRIEPNGDHAEEARASLLKKVPNPVVAPEVPQ